MTNKFRALEPIEPGEDSARPIQMGMDGGFRGDVSPRQLAPNETNVLDDIRFERTAIRKDFGWQSVGAAAAFPVLGLVEHKFIDGQLTFHRLVRVFRDGSNFAALEVWDGANWILVDTSTVTINNVYLSMVSAQGALYIAEGSQILCWAEELAKIPQEDDFPAGNKLTLIGEITVATVIPGDPIALDYDLNYDFTVLSSPAQDTTVVLEFLHLTTVLGEKTFLVPRTSTFPVTFLNEKFDIVRQIDSGDTVSIRVKSAEGGGTSAAANSISTAGTTPELEGVKTPALEPAIDDKYSFEIIFDFLGAGCIVEVGIYADFGAGFVKQTSVFIDEADQGDGTGFAFVDIIIPGLGVSGAQFGLHRESISGGGCSLPGGATFASGLQEANWFRTNADFEVHGHNKVTNLDATAGVTYETTGAAVTVFNPIDPGPGARYLVHFARRLVALQDLGDSQIFAFSADGILTDFESLGSGSLPLVSSRSDAIDALQGGAVLDSNFLAVFRKRSIMRSFETGNVALALGVVDWIEDLGTNYPFSIRNVRGGVMFLGHDNMMYFLTTQGPSEVGLPIHQELIENLTGDLTLVDSGYDPTFAEYYLGIPVGAATAIDRVWVFDVDQYLRDGSTIWRRKPMNIQRFATAGISEVE